MSAAKHQKEEAHVFAEERDRRRCDKAQLPEAAFGPLALLAEAHVRERPGIAARQRHQTDFIQYAVVVCENTLKTYDTWRERDVENKFRNFNIQYVEKLQ